MKPNTCTGENSIVIVQGANDHLTAAHIAQAENVIARAKVLCCQLEVPMEANVAALKLARKHQSELNVKKQMRRVSLFTAITIFNPAPGMADMNVTCLQHCDIVCPNENEVVEYANARKFRALTGRVLVKIAARLTANC